MRWSELNIDVHGKSAGKIKTFCPNCRDNRGNKRDKSLSCNLDTGLFKCHYCQWSGIAKEFDKKEAFMKKDYKRPIWRNNTELSDKLVKWFDERSIRQETLNRMKIGEGIEFMPQAEKKMNAIQFNYFLNGELINAKYRTGNKLFKLVAGAELILWNIDAIKGQKECVITEGEIDALSYIQAGYEYAVSVPNGANQNLEYLDNYIEEYMDDKDIVYIAADTDNRGLILRDELIRRLGAEKCRIVTYGEDCKDANEHLVKYGGYSLLQTLKNAKEVKLDGVFQVSDFEESLDALFESGLQKGQTIGHDNFDRLCSFETKRILIATGVPGSGKALSIDTLIPTNKGWKTMNDIKVGDELFDENGDICFVERETDIIYDRPCYKVLFSDGSEIVCDEQHLWVTRDHKAKLSIYHAKLNNRLEDREIKPKGTDQTNKRTFPSVKSTKQILETLTVENGKRKNHAISVCGALNYKNNLELLVKPYTLGVWLGDGSSYHSSIHSPDKEVLNRVVNDGYILKKWSSKIEYGVSGLDKQLKTLNLYQNKHIPIEYLIAPIKQRVELLRGLMDSDGYCDKNGNCEYTTIRKTLADHIFELVAGLGMKPTLRIKTPKIYGKECNTAYVISFAPKFNVFHLERKANRVRRSYRDVVNWRYIVDVIKVDSVPVRCIKVSSKTGQFLCGKTMIPTHNSEFVDEIAERLNMRYGWKFAYFSPENMPLQIHASKLISKITGMSFHKNYLSSRDYRQVKEYMEDNFFFICPEEDFSLDTILSKAKYLVKRRGIKALVLDPWNKIDHQIPPGMNETNYISKQLDKIITFSQRNDILTIVIAHPVKKGKDGKGEIEVPTLYDISGSANFFNKADFGITSHRDRINEIIQIHVQKVKFKHLGETGIAVFKYNFSNGRYVPYKEGEEIKWDYANHLSATKQEHEANLFQEYENSHLFDLTPTDQPPPF